MTIPVERGVNILTNHGVGPFCYHGLNFANLWLPAWNTLTSRRPVGTNVFERDWDLLVVLDAARVDCLREAAKTTPWLGDVDSMRSVGSMSAEWMLNTFTQAHEREIEDTAIVSGNGWSDYVLNDRYHERSDHQYEYMHPGYPKWQVVSPSTISYHESVTVTDEEGLKLHPESNRVPNVVTDRAIAIARERPHDRMIVHYNLPHLEHLAGALDWERGECSRTELQSGPEPTRDLKPEEKSWRPARDGDVTAAKVRSNYMKTLHFALEYVEILLENVDAETVAITADHGEAFGENGVWGHPYGHPFAPVKTVPWTTTTATDEYTYEPQYEKLDGPDTEEEQREFLKQMGYL